MKKKVIGVAMVAQNDAETIETSIKSFYDEVDFIAISIDVKHGWSGKRITEDNTIDVIKTLDLDNKIDIIQSNFYRFDDPMKNETAQRQLTSDWLSNKYRDLEWICQIDADEIFPNFKSVVDFINSVPSYCRGIQWHMAQIFNLLEDGRVLVVVNNDGVPVLSSFYLAHRPFQKLVVARLPAIVPFNLNRQTLRINEILLRTNSITKFIRKSTPRITGPACLHYTFAKSERRIREKLDTWGHAYDFETDQFFQLWKNSKSNWINLKNFHPLDGPVWPALKPFSLDELAQYI